jgi:bifunctional DNase/RNase
MKDVIEAHGSQLKEVHITELHDGVFFAVLVFSGGQQVSARPSDAIALALRAGAPVLVDEGVLDEAAVELPDEEEGAEEPADEQREVARFREFLDQISPEDFDMGGESGPVEGDGGSR